MSRFKPNYQITIISGCGLAGIIVALILLALPKKPATGSVFHEVGYVPRQIVNHAIRHLTDSLGKDSADSAAVAVLNGYRIYSDDSTLTDTNALRLVSTFVHFGIQPSQVAQWDSAYRAQGDGWRDSLPYFARFPVGNRHFFYKGEAQFKIITYKSNIEFMAKYPQAAAWVFMVVILCGFCFIAIPACIYIMEQVQTIFRQEERPAQKGYWIATPIVAGALLLFLIVLFFTFADEPPVKDLYFMRTLSNFLLFADVLGCVSGAFCLAGFIHSASMLGYFADKVNTQTTKVRIQREVMKKALVAPGAPTTPVEVKAIEGSDEEEEKHKLYAGQFRKLLGFFHRYFILSAVLLSLVVLCTGELYNTTNSLSFVSLLRINWGYSPTSGDTVYLFGGLFTAILLLVYLPTKMQFGDVQLRLPDDSRVPDDDDDEWYGFLEQPFGWLRGGLIAASPFLIGLIQNLLGLLTKH